MKGPLCASLFLAIFRPLNATKIYKFEREVADNFWSDGGWQLWRQYLESAHLARYLIEIEQKNMDTFGHHPPTQQPTNLFGQ